MGRAAEAGRLAKSWARETRWVRRDAVPVRGWGQKGRRAHSQETGKGVNQAALDSLLRQSRAAKQRLTVTSPGGDRGRADPAGLQVFLRRGHLPLVPRQRVTSGPLCAPPTRRRRRLREPEDARALGGPREALREPDRRARRAHTGRAPPIFPGSAPPLSGEAGGGGGAGLRRAVKSSAWLVPRARARSRGGRPPLPGVAPRRRRRRRQQRELPAAGYPHQTAAAAPRSGTNRHGRRHPADRPGSFSAASLKQAGGRGGA